MKITQCNNNKTMMLMTLVETIWIYRKPRPIKIMYEIWAELLGHKFKDTLLQDKSSILTKPETSGNLQSNYTTKLIHHILGNIIRKVELDNNNNVDEDEPWERILTEAYFSVHYTHHKNKQIKPGQSVFGWDMIMPI